MPHEKFFSSDESVSFEHNISDKQRIVVTNKRVYVSTSDDSSVNVVFRKAIIGCKYQLYNSIPAGVVIITLTIMFSIMYSSQFTPWVGGLLFLFCMAIGAAFLFKAEKIEIVHTGGRPITISSVSYFAFAYTPKLQENIKHIISLEDA